MHKSLQENISRIKELLYTKNNNTLKEDIMSGPQGGYADTDGATHYTFTSKGALGSEPELEDEGFTEPETNYSKDWKGYNFNSEGPEDSYEEPQEFLEQDAGTESGESSDAAGAGTASMGVWETGITRGSANQIINSKWADSYQTSRGKANQLV